jgi:cyclophilin family peptidyl-prolyl cis-trans isomerase
VAVFEIWKYSLAMRRYSKLILLLLSMVSVAAYADEPPFELPARNELLKLKTAVITTSKGAMRFELFPEDAPWHVANFKYLADKGFYRGLTFSYFHPGYIIQGGAPRGESGPGYSLPAEFSNRKHEFGVLGMARRKDFVNPERRSNGSQFHILLKSDERMDGVYTIFGKLIEGDEVLNSLNAKDTIVDVKVYVRR